MGAFFMGAIFQQNVGRVSPSSIIPLLVTALVLNSGCRIPSLRQSFTLLENRKSESSATIAEAEPKYDLDDSNRNVEELSDDSPSDPAIIQTALNDSENPGIGPPEMTEEEAPAPENPPDELTLSEVLDSVSQTYPLLEAALFGRNVALGNRISAEGSFDLKLKASSENGPVGFYETYRNMAGIEKPLFMGGSVFAGYRVGRGNFQPWYLERQTNDGGEFKVGAQIPLLQNRRIDERRTNLFNTDWARQEVEPTIRTELIGYIYLATIAYWDWVGAGRNYEISESFLDLATIRKNGLETRVKRGDLERIELVDNRRLIVSREAKLVDARRKFEQTSAKLSLFFRNADGEPQVPTLEMLPKSFPAAEVPEEEISGEDLQIAYQNRPELQVYDLQIRQVDNELAWANNQKLPTLDAAIAGSDDVGEPTSSKKDKSPLELEAGLYFDVPIQRRKAGGKVIALEGKRAQLVAKKRFSENKILNELQLANAALKAAYQRIGQASESRDLARQMEEAERKKFDLGASNLLFVNTREQQSVDAQLTEVEAKLEYFDAKAAYHAALGVDRLPE